MPAARLTPRGGRRGRTPIKAIFDSDDSSDDEAPRQPARPAESSGSDDDESDKSPSARGRPLPVEKSPTLSPPPPPARKAASPSPSPSPSPRPAASGVKSRLGDRTRASPSSSRVNGGARTSGTPPRPPGGGGVKLSSVRQTPPSVRRALAANLDDSETELDQSMVSNASASTSASTLFWQSEARGHDGPPPTISQSPLMSPFKPPPEPQAASGDVVGLMENLYKTHATAMMGSAYQELRVGAASTGGAGLGAAPGGSMDDLLKSVDQTLSQARETSGSAASMSSLASSLNATPQRSPVPAAAPGSGRRGRVRIDTSANSTEGGSAPYVPASPGLKRRLEKVEQRMLAQPSPGAVSSKLYSTELRTSAQVKEVHSRLQDLETEMHQLKAAAAPAAVNTRGAAVRAASIEADVKELQERLAQADEENDALRERLEAAEAKLMAAGELAHRLAAAEQRAAGDNMALASEVSAAGNVARQAAERTEQLEEELEEMHRLRAAVRALEERVKAGDDKAGSGALEQRCIAALEDTLGGEADGLAARVERLEVRARKGDQGRQELHDELVDVISSVQSLESRSPVPGQARTLAALQAEVAAALGGLEDRVAAAEELTARAGRLMPPAGADGDGDEGGSRGSGGGGGEGGGGGGVGGFSSAAMDEVTERLKALEAVYHRLAKAREDGGGAKGGGGGEGGSDPKLEGRMGEVEENLKAIMGHLDGTGVDVHETAGGRRSALSRAAWCLAFIMLVCGLAALGGMLYLMWADPELTLEDEIEAARECVADLAQQYLPAMGLMETGRAPT